MGGSQDGETGTCCMFDWCQRVFAVHVATAPVGSGSVLIVVLYGRHTAGENKNKWLCAKMRKREKASWFMFITPVKKCCWSLFITVYVLAFRAILSPSARCANSLFVCRYERGPEEWEDPVRRRELCCATVFFPFLGLYCLLSYCLRPLISLPY